MKEDFARILTMLRKERNISQREAAKELGISQALLSHYEIGRRGCNLEFVIKVADYYSVSCDYLLGRSPDKDGAMIKVEDIPEPDAVKDNVMNKFARGSMVAVLNKKLVANSLNVLYDGLIRCGNKTLTNEVSQYLFLSVYKMFRKVYDANDKNPSQMFSVPHTVYSCFGDAAMNVTEARIDAVIAGKEPDSGEKVKGFTPPQMTTESIAQDYPLYATSLMNVIQYAESRMDFKK